MRGPTRSSMQESHVMCTDCQGGEFAAPQQQCYRRSKVPAQAHQKPKTRVQQARACTGSLQLVSSTPKDGTPLQWRGPMICDCNCCAVNSRRACRGARQHTHSTRTLRTRPRWFHSPLLAQAHISAIPPATHCLNCRLASDCSFCLMHDHQASRQPSPNRPILRSQPLQRQYPAGNNAAPPFQTVFVPQLPVVVLLMCPAASVHKHTMLVGYNGSRHNTCHSGRLPSRLDAAWPARARRLRLKATAPADQPQPKRG